MGKRAKMGWRRRKILMIKMVVDDCSVTNQLWQNGGGFVIRGNRVSSTKVRDTVVSSCGGQPVVLSLTNRGEMTTSLALLRLEEPSWTRIIRRDLKSRQEDDRSPLQPSVKAVNPTNGFSSSDSPSQVLVLRACEIEGRSFVSPHFGLVQGRWQEATK